jgi:type IV pilus assembly protein PilY1
MKFKKKLLLLHSRVWFSAAFLGLLQFNIAAHAVSANYSGIISQLPSIYSIPPNPNVMLTLDDSSSMYSDVIPDLSSTGIPAAILSDPNSGHGYPGFPNMWGPGSLYMLPQYFSQAEPTARYLRSAAGNPIYYNPNATYKPWPLANNDRLLHPNAQPNKVRISVSSPLISGVPENSGGTVYPEHYVDLTRALSDNVTWPGTYFVYTGRVPLTIGYINAPENVIGSFIRFEIKPGSVFPRGGGRTDCRGPIGPAGCSYAEELQNFANWLQYYRNRRLMAKGSVANAFAKQGPNIRVGFGSINSRPVVRLGVRDFSNADPANQNRRNFFNDLYTLDNGGDTPLRLATDEVGKYFQTTTADSPYGALNTTKNTCRRSFHILATDGFWNGWPVTGPASQNNDDFSTGSGKTPAKPDGTTYTYSDAVPPMNGNDPLLGRFTLSPFKDTHANTLSDVAAYYWRTDLRPDMKNTVSSSARDPAFWQHLTMFTVGLGMKSRSNSVSVNGSGTIPAAQAVGELSGLAGLSWLVSPRSRDYLVNNRIAATWSDPSGGSSGDALSGDLVHTALSARGRYFSATDATSFTNSLSSALAEVADQTLSQSGLASNIQELSTATAIYQATFSPDRWKGYLYAYSQNRLTGEVQKKPPLWEASEKMLGFASRNIATNTGNVVPGAGNLNQGRNFVWAALTSAQQAALQSPNILDFLRGDWTGEMDHGGALRDRSHTQNGAGVVGAALGDIVNSSPVRGPDAQVSYGYDRLPTGDPAGPAYAAFLGRRSINLSNTIFVGANDGMLHAFDTATGIERFAYVPASVYEVPRSSSSGQSERKLRMLADPSAEHRFTVDGTPQVGDAYLNRSWKTILLSATGAGSRSIFALDVTNPAAFTPSQVLWEYGEVGNADNDMGYVLATPHIARMRNGQWAAVFGNGYDSANGRAALYIVNLENGELISKIAVPAGVGTGNGLSQPRLLVNTQREVVAAYAGDLKGNLWKFDLSSPAKTSWKLAFADGSPLIKAVSTAPAGGVQPISSMPAITQHPTEKDAVMVVFGTGKLFEASDNAITGNINLSAGQSLYGVWDKIGELSGTSRSALEVQTLGPVQASGYTTTSSNPVDWTQKRGWVMDLTPRTGERVHIAPRQVFDVVFFTANTLVDSDPCINEGTGKLIAIDPATGMKPSFNVFGLGAVVGSNVFIHKEGILSRMLFHRKDGGSDERTQGCKGASGVLDGSCELDANTQKSCAEVKGEINVGSSDGTILHPSTDAVVAMGLSCKGRVSWRQLQ